MADEASRFDGPGSEGRASPIDVHVGARIRMRRTLLGMSQERLGDALGLTFQQVQKYERGVNRVSASRLFDLARVLEVPIGYFYDDLPESAAADSPARRAGVPGPTIPFGFAEQQEPFGGPAEDSMTKRETLDLVRAYYRINDQGVRKRVLDLIKSMGPQETA
jgi:transcriptional regulator with XRE-family HTH domain